LRDIRSRGYGAWRFDAQHAALHDRLTRVLDSLGPGGAVTSQLTTLMTMLTLESVTGSLEYDLATTEFIVLPIFGDAPAPQYQIEIRLAEPDTLTLDELGAALVGAQQLLSPAIG
jgi:hypothetical protein